MCDPVSLTTAAVQGGSMILGHRSEAKQAQQQNIANAQNRASALAATIAEYVAAGQQSIQQGEAATQEKGQVALDARAAQATATMAAGEAGVSGLSVSGLLQEFAGKAGRYNASVDQQLRWNEDQTIRTMKGIRAQGADRINGARDVKGPSFLGTTLRIAGAGLDAYNSHTARVEAGQQKVAI